MKIAFVGFGNVARAFARIIDERRTELAHRFDLTLSTVAIATANHGSVRSTDSIDLINAVACVEQGGNLTRLPQTIPIADTQSLLEGCDADLIFETTPLNIEGGQPAVTHIRTALRRGIHVVTANKGPIAFAYEELRSLAQEHEVEFRFEGTVMDGAPVFNLVESCLPGARVLGFSGVLNSTTNLILTEMESGHSFEESLKEAQRLGIAETNAEHDIDGWDAAVKAVALANVLMNANAHPADVAREGIAGITVENLKSASESGSTLRLIARARLSERGIRLSVAPEKMSVTSLFGSARGTSNVLMLETDLMGELAIVENNPGVEQTAYALLSDLLNIHRSFSRSKK
jgi:homoserine dehydrogenase